jgi:hypothetical protein
LAQADRRRRLIDFTPQELAELMTTPGERRELGRPRDDRFFHVMAFRERMGVPAGETLQELLAGREDSDRLYDRLLKRYERCRAEYLKVGLALRETASGRLEVVPVAPADLPNLPEPIFDVEELFNKKP